MSVKVTKVMVVYEKDDSAFVVELDPDKVGTIVLSTSDLMAAQKGLKRTPDDKRFNAKKSFPGTGTKRVSPQATEPPEFVANTDDDPFGFWWRENGSWFHAV
jgi:hypothetical protein